MKITSHQAMVIACLSDHDLTEQEVLRLASENKYYTEFYDSMNSRLRTNSLRRMVLEYLSQTF